ncbi:leishmanolysin-related zinc metalloendopeptidase [Croceitalea sp. MTPC9]|uniref:leishmanolysin-related zinc metalloendopeptidase n=1 Tax=unclassified Croceitalea TaxID=2632280 RepID=UPI002B3DA9F3|nr:leishmanolysin-related zinc metalloendopeptidase [Croceitalea sp. MTPC6]GMN18419.1 leishmanolysin-related zinc metalloendopeptidase [Croceitalea sp. MTPC9]
MGFTIEIRFLGGLTSSQQIVFEEASSRWSELITGDLPRVQLANGEIIEDVRIDAQAVNIDGSLGILGQAGPTQLRAESFLPATGIMQFDTADLARLEAEDSLKDAIIHEMGHVLGFGTLWSSQFLNLITGEGSENPTFTGTNAIREYKILRQEENLINVPLANTGGQGTRDGHWREAIFSNELMTGFINMGDNPISRLSIAAFEDMGYTVDYNKSNEYRLPEVLTLKNLKELNQNNQCKMCSSKILRCDPIILPKTAFID